MKLYTFLIGLALPMLSQGAIVSNTSPGVNWAPFSVSKTNAVLGADIGTLTITLFDGSNPTPYDIFNFSYILDTDGETYGVDTLNVTITSEDFPFTQESYYRGGPFTGPDGVIDVGLGNPVIGLDWARERTSTYVNAPATAGNLAYDDADSPGAGEGFFYDVAAPAYLGFRFSFEEIPSPADFYYGWVQITSVGATTLNIEAWAYNDILGEDIAAGVVPEPGTVAIWFGAGGMVLWFWLRRKGISA